MQILLDKGVQESKIIFLCIIAAPEGIHKVSVWEGGGGAESKIIFLCIIAAPEGIHKVSVWEGGRVAETPRRDGGRQ